LSCDVFKEPEPNRTGTDRQNSPRNRTEPNRPSGRFQTSPTFGNEPDDRQPQPLVRCASVALAAASPDTWDDQRDARLAHCTRAASAGAVAARVLRRPVSRDEFELALGQAMTALQLGNCDLVRLRGTSDGGEAARLCGPAVARWRSVHANRTAPSATTRRARRPDEAGHDTSPS
jgi:hypothetical protein